MRVSQIHGENARISDGNILPSKTGGGFEVFITHSYIKARQLQYDLHPKIQQEQHPQIISHSEVSHKQIG